MSTDDNDAKRRELEKQLAVPDAVLEPSVWSVISRYMAVLKRAGEQNKDIGASVVKQLANSYIGYPEMACLVCEWLQTLGDTAHDHTQQDEPGTLGRDSSAAERDEYFFLSELVKESFKPEHYADAFAKGAPPDWARDLIQEPRGRQLIYELASRHTNSILLGWAITKILAAGHEAEVASTGSAMAGYFGVFYRLMGRYFTSAMSASEAEWLGIEPQLADAALQGQHTYIFTQAMLSMLCEHSNAVVFQHLKHALTTKAQHRVGSSIHELQRLFAMRHTIEDSAAIPLLTSIFKCRWQDLGNVKTLAQLQDLAALYKASPAPSVALIQQPRLFELLNAALFSIHKRSNPPGFQEAVTELLAMASCLSDADVSGTSANGGVAALTAGSSGDAWAAVEEAKTAVLNASLLLRAFFSSDYCAPDSFEDIDQVLACPVAAVGLVSAMQPLLATEDFYTDAISLSALPHMVLLLLRIVRVQPCAQVRVVRLIRAALPVTGAERSDIAQAYLRVLLEIMLCGRVEQVLSCVEDWAKTADPSLARHFVVSVLSFCDRPYSSWFTTKLIDLMVDSDVQRRREVGKAGELRNRLLHLFAKEVSSMRFEPPLSETKRKYIADLARDLH